MDQVPEPPPNVRSKSRSRSTSPSRRRPLGPGIPVSELRQEEDEERSHSHGRGARRDDSVRVIDSVRASFDRVLTESKRRREEGYGHLAEDGVVCRLASKSLTGDEEGHVRTDTNEGRRRVLAWLRGLGVRVDKAWLPRCETGLDQSRRSKEGRVAPGRWGDELCNGVMLCELAAILEARDDAARARADLRCIDGRFLLKGTEGKPRCYAQVRLPAATPLVHVWMGSTLTVPGIDITERLGGCTPARSLLETFSLFSPTIVKRPIGAAQRGARAGGVPSGAAGREPPQPRRRRTHRQRRPRGKQPKE